MKNKLFKGIICLLLFSMVAIPIVNNNSSNVGNTVVTPMSIEDPGYF
jgi:hypothetical protein